MKIIYSQFIPQNTQWEQSNPQIQTNVLQQLEPQIQTQLPLQVLNSDQLPNVTQQDIQRDSQEQQNKNAQQSNSTKEKQYPSFNSIFSAYRWGKQNTQVIRIKYKCESGRQILRDIQPHGDFFPKTTKRRNFIVWDQTVGGIRGYIMENIIQYSFIGKQFTMKFNFSQTRKNYKRKVRKRVQRNRQNKERQKADKVKNYYSVYQDKAK